MTNMQNNTVQTMLDKLKVAMTTQRPEIPASIPQGDMPGDQIKIDSDHIQKATTIFSELLPQLTTMLSEQKMPKIVLTVCGGSGVGKSETASLLSYYFNQIGIGCYTLSGDNYPHRIPKYNDAERLRMFRQSAIRGMLKDQTYSKERFDFIHKQQLAGNDANQNLVAEHPWYASYLQNGRLGLQSYLGSTLEINFDELSRILTEFKEGSPAIWLKRMGREDTELWYEEVDFSNIQILIIEWTHGNSDNYTGVDLPILLNSTPQETLAHRKARNRDGGTDSPFTTMVLELEQAMLEAQAHKAKIILSKQGNLLSYEEYQKIMKESKGAQA